MRLHNTAPCFLTWAGMHPRSCKSTEKNPPANKLLPRYWTLGVIFTWYRRYFSYEFQSAWGLILLTSFDNCSSQPTLKTDTLKAVCTSVVDPLEHHHVCQKLQGQTHCTGSSHLWHSSPNSYIPGCTKTQPLFSQLVLTHPLKK